MELALNEGWSDRHLRTAVRKSRDPLYECADEIRDQANKILKKSNRQMRSLADEWFELLKQFNRGAKANADIETIETEYLEAPIMMHLGCDGLQARDIARDLMRGCRALEKLSKAKPRRAMSEASEIGGQIFHLACAWLDVFGNIPGWAKSDKCRFGNFVAELLGSAPSGQLRKAIAGLNAATAEAISQSGYCQWVLGRRTTSIFPRNALIHRRAPL